MYYRKFKPSNELVPYVECYFIWDSEGELDSSLTVESPPNGFCSMVFNYGEPYSLQNKKYDRFTVPMQFISGQNIYSFKLFLERRIGIAGIVFKPAALATIFGFPMYEFVEDRIDLYKILKKEIADKPVAAINSCSLDGERVHALEDFLLQQVRMLQPTPDYIDDAANLILEHNGMLEVNDLLKNSFMSRRTFERKFFRKVGLSPKYFARVRRISYLCNLIAGKKKVDWAEIFYRCDYYDQAHFIKDFEEFTGRTPQQYLKENTELANYVEKPQSES